jgi:hypothetical protein
LKKNPLRQKPGSLFPALSTSFKAVIGKLGQIYHQITLRHLLTLPIEHQNGSNNLKNGPRSQAAAKGRFSGGRVGLPGLGRHFSKRDATVPC